MNGPDHYRKAEEFLNKANQFADAVVEGAISGHLSPSVAEYSNAALPALAALAQAHAELAHVAAVADTRPERVGGATVVDLEWRAATS